MLKFLTKFDYLLKETFLGLLRGGWMNWAAISTVTVLLFLFGLSLHTSWQVEKLLHQFGNQLEIAVYLQPDTPASAIAPDMMRMQGVASMQTITKEEAWSQLVQELGISSIDGATQHLGDNPLVDEIKVKALDLSPP